MARTKTGSEDANKIAVPEALRSPHPFVVATMEALGATEKKGVSRTVNRRLPHLDIDTTSTTLRRALRIMDSLVKALEKRGWPVSLGTGEDLKTYVTVLEQRIPFGIRETSTKARHERDSGVWSTYSYPPAGRLTLVIRESWGHSV